MDLPLIKPEPPKLSRMLAGLEAIEASGTYSNNGPVVRRFEQAATEQLFGGRGGCLAASTATLGLMIALRHATMRQAPGRQLVLMPAFTFAATADGGTDVTMSFGAEPVGTMGKVFGPVAFRLMRKSVAGQLAKDLDDLARAAEQG